ncbi:Uncharacterised protein [Chryseobacterium taklimakanense]|uniref:Uncharacterized protein n=1 Tax=Chryseobacterium taklimakanense TaxID=536441 RepID=A0A239XVL6_9FLAO|nr:hypothetical protein [Chryseobacterium taklimakanense]SNV50442.1 Uncharacterised protein [Chryseobacterium taklimakanense]
MENLNSLEEYFVKIYKNYGITSLDFRDNKLEIDDQLIKHMVFASDDFNSEFDNLLEHCLLVYSELQRNFSLKVKRDINNNYFVLVA